MSSDLKIELDYKRETGIGKRKLLSRFGHSSLSDTDFGRNAEQQCTEWRQRMPASLQCLYSTAFFLDKPAPPIFSPVFSFWYVFGFF